MHTHIVFRGACLAALGAGSLAVATPASEAHASPAPVQAPARAASPDTPQAFAEVANGRLAYEAAAGQANRVTFTMGKKVTEGERYLIPYTIDDVYGISAGDDCDYPVATDLTKVICKVEAYDTPSPYVTAIVKLGDRDDTLRFHNVTGDAYYGNEFWAGSGDDRIDTRQKEKVMDGSAIWGQNGNDVIHSGEPGDNGSVLGGNGNDTIYQYEGGRASGGNGNDKLYGIGGSHWFSGDDGNDLLDGGPGGDRLLGGKGNDTVHGRRGADTIYGNSGNDKLYGGPGSDEIFGGPGKDLIKHD
ncbi:calcium-binding protein [Kineosporia succinea]|uniref:Ca2+-binding RTX toxin-like protein n=1 Tax=Kineosporia succinea TaxID=84632 RepID=A0ABT9NYK7_9ACTN|nr:calcium-binding protein [Kineosporia succinea]MDP9825075.1 Ca2+-binding RTX toxin-like protein [Kineosporia succinea]